MKSISVAICDDLKEERVSLAQMVQHVLQKREIQPEVKLFSSGDELAHTYVPGQFHMIFLDIYMPDVSGVEVARAIRAKDSGVALIFATTSVDHGLESFDVQAADYLVKPFRESDVEETVAWCLSHLPDKMRSLCVNSNWEQTNIPIETITYIEILGHQSHIHLKNRVIVARRGLDELESDIASSDFLRCHRSYLVNLNYVQGVGETDFLLADGTKVPIASAGFAKIRQQFIEWTYRKAWEQK